MIAQTQFFLFHKFVSLKVKLIIIFLISYIAVSAQQKTHNSIDSTKIDSKLIVGFWESADSNKYRIEFNDEQWAVKLKAEVGVAGGYFFSKDSTGMMQLSGWAPNWPPYDCSLYLKASDTLEVTTLCFMCDAITCKYVRVKKEIEIQK